MRRARSLFLLVAMMVPQAAWPQGGIPVGPEFRVNTYTTNLQIAPSVAADSAGDFVVVWTSQQQDGSSYGVFGQRYSPIVPVELMHFRVE